MLAIPCIQSTYSEQAGNVGFLYSVYNMQYMHNIMFHNAKIRIIFYYHAHSNV